MICPRCETEYVEGIEVCRDCGTELIPREEFEGNLVHPSDWVILYTTNDMTEAEMLRANLDGADIEANILGQKDSSFPAVGDLAVIKLLVRKKDVDEALKIYEDIFRQRNDEDKDNE